MQNYFMGLEITKQDTSGQYNSITGMYDDPVQNEDVEKGGSKWPSISGSAGDGEDDDEEEFEKFVPMIAAIEKGDEHIVYGIVYEPDTEDAQGDQADAEEIKKAAYDFMENVQTFKVMHKGKPAKVKVLESYIAPTAFTVAKRKVKAGSWVLVTRINDSKIWKAIKDGKLTGYSMAGYATTAA